MMNKHIKDYKLYGLFRLNEDFTSDLVDIFYPEKINQLGTVALHSYIIDHSPSKIPIYGVSKKGFPVNVMEKTGFVVKENQIWILKIIRDRFNNFYSDLNIQFFIKKIDPLEYEEYDITRHSLKKLRRHH